MHLRKLLLHVWNLWPPFFFSGIKITKRSKDFRHFTVKLKLRFWNANYVGTQYGGSIFSMTDPFYMIMLMHNLGKDFVVWDKSATIRYKKPGKSDLWAEFNLSEQDLDEIRHTIENQGYMHWIRLIEIKDNNQEIVAEVEKVISIKPKKH